MNAAVALSQANIGYGKTPILANLSLEIEIGQWVSLLGPNGSGKTSLLRALLGSLTLQAGRRLCQVQRLGYVPQRFDFSLDNPITVKEFLELQTGTNVLSHPVLDVLKVSPLFKTPLRILSRGELKKVLLAFALVHDPEILFLDEYLEGLDPSAQNLVTGYLETLHAQKKVTVIEVSHDLTSVVHVANRVVVLQGQILFDGSPKDHGFHECLHHVYGHHNWIQNDA